MDKNDNKKAIKLDRFYNLVRQGATGYNDNLGALIEEISVAKEKNEISDAEASMLVKLALIVEAQKEVQGLSEWMKALNDTQETSSILINLSHRERKYA